LHDLYKRSSQVKPYKLAISDKTEIRSFFFNKNNGTNSLLRIAPESGKYVDANEMQNIGSIDVQTTTLDNFCLDKHIERIQILKIDIQGGELMALRGATGLLEKQTIDLLYVEVLFVPLYKGQAYFCDLHEFLAQYGYVLYGLYGLDFGRNSVLSWADAIFINSRVEEELSHESLYR
jgi:FkbM family methyltransferase